MTKRRWIERTFTLLVLVCVLALFSFFLRGVLIPFLKFQIAHDAAGARELLRARGLFGCFAVMLVEALQMVVIFIPAEFIQISSGLSYPFPVALLLCDLGVCLGATIIFVLVRTFRFGDDLCRSKRERIERICAQHKEQNTVLLLYFLFFMPIIPFGAICYYGSSTGIRYWKYILTVATGVVPSIVVSNLMGAAARAFLINALPIWLLLFIIVLLAAVLFTVILVFLDRIWFKKNSGTPDSILYAAFFRFAHFLRKNRQTLHLGELPADLRPPYVVLCNHESFYDFYYLWRLIERDRPAFVANRYYLTRPVVRHLWQKAGFIPKKLFCLDAATALGVIRMLRRGYPVVIFPEGRLSPDGAANPILEKGAAYYRRLNADLVLVNLSGAYYAKPKWRKKFYQSHVTVEVARVIRKEEIGTYTDAQLDDLIDATLRREASAGDNRYLQKDKAKGLENLLYRCADCGALYTTVEQGSALRCTACGAVHTLDEQYRFDGKPETIAAYYRAIAEMERRELDALSLETAVRVKVFDAEGRVVRRERGVCTLTPQAFSYRAGERSFTVPTAALPALPFSCNEEFELYHQNQLYYFYPEEQPRAAARWALAVDLLTERRLFGSELTETSKEQTTV